MCSGNTYPLVIAAHPHEPNQFALGMTDGGVLLIEPAESEGKCPSCCAAWNRSNLRHGPPHYFQSDY